MSEAVRKVNTVPNVRIKKEIVLSEDEDEVSCSVCSKGFANEVALKNHVRMEHIDIYAKGDPSAWIQKLNKPFKNKVSPYVPTEEEKKKMKEKTHQLLASLAPGNLLSLASEDVNYIIIQAEDLPKLRRDRKTQVVVKEKVEEKEKPPPPVKEKKVPQPITGPFECFQPSTLVADGTCHQIFFSCCEYSAHFRDEHTRRRKGHRCQVCEKPLTNPGEEAFPFCCDVCGAGFSLVGELAEHAATAHVKLKPFACSVCGKRFTQQGGVQQHMRMHTGDRPFSCTFCPKSFTQKSGLDQHVRIHTKTKPYRCIICSKAFCQSIHLKQHMRTHTNVSPFMCGICNKRFKQSSHLNYHLKNHNPSTMTEEQKLKYAELIGMINKEVEIEIDASDILVEQMKKEKQSEEEVEIEIDSPQVLVEQMETEKEPQYVEEETVQIVSTDGEEYILSDNNESWHIELVQS